MRTTYEYSISGDISNHELNMEVLDKSLKLMTLSNSTYLGSSSIGDTLYVIFSEEITSGEKTTLDDIVFNHDSTTTLINKTFPLSMTPIISVHSNTYYKEIGSIIYSGSNEIGPIIGINVSAYCDPGSTSYDILIINGSNNSEIASQNFTNTSPEILSLNSINSNNVPENISEITVSCRVNKNGNAVKNIYIKNIIFWIG